MIIVLYIIAAGAGLLLSGIGVMFAMLNGLEFAFLIGGLLAAAHVGSFFFVRKKASQGKGRQTAFVLAMPLFLVGGVVYILAVIYALVSSE